ncbi:MAG: hypothetical protein ABIO19_13990 [Burkholderiaceae bacterium]
MQGFAVFGGIGIALGLGLGLVNLSWTLFKNSFAVVAVLTLLGFALSGAGVWWSRHEVSISARLRNFLPQDLRELLKARSG